MSRPLVIKIASHNSQPNNKAIGSIDVTLLRAAETRSPENPPLSHDQTSSLVRNLVHKYESSAPSNLVKRRSKSMADLNEQNKPKIGTQKTQDDTLYHKNKNIDLDGEVFEEWRQNFKHALNKFKKSPGNNVLTDTDKPPAVHDIRHKAQILLESTKHDYFWFNQVMELLQQIVNQNQLVFTNDSANHSRSRSVSIVSSSSHGDNAFSETDSLESSNKVSEIKQMYEKKALQNPKLYSETTKNIKDKPHFERKLQEHEPEVKLKVPLKYFGRRNEDSDESTLTDTDENQTEDDQITTQMQDIELSDRDDQYETIELDTHEELQETSGLHSLASEEALNMVEEMLKKIEDCDKKIDSISTDNKTEANYINDVLIQVLIKLDDLKTYDDGGVIVTMRRKAFAFTQDCIKKLKIKVFGEDEV